MLLQGSRVGKVGYPAGPLPALIGRRAGKAVQVGQQAGLLGGLGGTGHPCPHLFAVSPYSQGHIRGHQWSPLPLPPPPPQSRALGKGLHHLPPSWRSLQSQWVHGSLSWRGEGTRDRSRAATEQGPSPASSPAVTPPATSSSNTGCWQVERGATPAAPDQARRWRLHARALRLRFGRLGERASERANERGASEGRVRGQMDHSRRSMGRGAQRMAKAVELTPAGVAGSAAHGPARLGTVCGPKGEEALRIARACVRGRANAPYK